MRATNTAFGAMAIVTLRAFKKEGRLNAESLPSLESFLQNFASVGEAMDARGCECTYADVARGIAERLFEHRTQQQLEVEYQQREEWVRAVATDEDDRKALEKYLRNMRHDWYIDGIAHEDLSKHEFASTRAWKHYETYLSGCPKGPLRGPSWEISSWSEEDKAEFSVLKEEDSEMLVWPGQS